MADSPNRPAALAWLETRWNGESAFRAETSSWLAIVSLDRCRLVHFGPIGAPDVNLLFAPTAPNTAAGFGGHRVWFGPQQEWASPWPPPDAWEASGADRWTVTKQALALEAKRSPKPWPSLIRTYRVERGMLVCGVTAEGGERPAQFMQILQTPTSTVARLRAPLAPEDGEGFRILRLDTAGIGMPPQLRRNGDGFDVRYQAAAAKLAFPPQPIFAATRGVDWIVGRGSELGPVAFQPDSGFHTQIYCGAPDQADVVELEQMSPAFHPASGASSEMTLSIRHSSP